ncbi:MAG: DnaB-like helicase C-terminal domain-containing protein [Thermodesulfovibrionales bacterium]|jgi:hypothetical protein
MKRIKLFMASPDDTSEERRIYTEVVESINRSRGTLEDFYLEPVKWESYAYPETGNPQDIINRLLEDAELVIIVFWNKIGAPTKNFPSGTMEEFFVASDNFRATGKPSIKIYFRKPSVPKNKVDAEELVKLFEVKESIKNMALYKDYETQEDFRKLLHEHINGWLSKNMIKSAVVDVGIVTSRMLSDPTDSRILLKDIFEKVEEKYDGKKSKLNFGLEALDDIVGEIEERNFILVAGDTASGKTSLLLTVVKNTAIFNAVPILYFSMRSRKREIMEKLLSNASEVDVDSLKRGRLRKDDWHKITSAASMIGEAPIFIDDNTEMTLQDLTNQAEIFQKNHKMSLVIIDGLNYVSGEEGRVGYGVRLLSRHLHAPIIATLQLATPRRPAPIMSDLDPFGDIKTEADVVLFLCPRVRVNWSEKHNGKVNWDIIVAKNTGGPTATCEVDLIPNFCAFVDVM